jgi:hypothetical protein
MQCPYYNGATYRDLSGVLYRIYCGMASVSDSAGTTVTSTVYSMAGCMSACYNLNTHDCTGFTYTVNKDQQEEATDFNGGTCILRRDATAASVQTPPSGTTRTVALTNYAQRLGNFNTIATPPQTSPASSSVPVGTYTSAPPVPTTCPDAADGTRYTNGNAQPYTLYCNSNWSGFIAVSTTITNFEDCTRFCDATLGCGAALWDKANTCYAKPPANGGGSFSGTGFFLGLRVNPPNYSTTATTTTTTSTTTSTTTTTVSPACVNPSLIGWRDYRLTLTQDHNSDDNDNDDGDYNDGHGSVIIY